VGCAIARVLGIILSRICRSNVCLCIVFVRMGPFARTRRAMHFSYLRPFCCSCAAGKAIQLDDIEARRSDFERSSRADERDKGGRTFAAFSGLRLTSPQECFSIESDMAMETRKGREWQEEICYRSEVAEAPGHPFYCKLEAKLKEAGFDRFCEEECKQFYARPLGQAITRSGVYFRLMLIGFFEGIDSERGIAWWVADSLSFAHQVDTGGVDRLYLRGRENIHKRLLIRTAACNLALLLRSLYGAGKPRAAHGLKPETHLAFLRLTIALFGMGCLDLASTPLPCTNACDRTFSGERACSSLKENRLDTGC
jgi:hypothetical protein